METLNDTIRITRLVEPVVNAVQKPTARFSNFCGYRRYLFCSLSIVRIEEVVYAVHKPNLHLYSTPRYHSQAVTANTTPL